MNLIKKIALLSLIASIATMNVQAKQDDQDGSGISQLRKTLHDLRSKPENKLDTSKEVSLEGLSPFNLESIRTAILKVRFGSDYDAYKKASDDMETARTAKQATQASKDRFNEIGKSKGIEPSVIDADFAALTALITQRNAINQVIKSEDLGSSLSKTSYTIGDLSKAIKACKCAVLYPIDGASYQAIVDFVSRDIEASPVTLADAEEFIRALNTMVPSGIKAIKAKYKNSKDDNNS